MEKPSNPNSDSGLGIISWWWKSLLIQIRTMV